MTGVPCQNENLPNSVTSFGFDAPAIHLIAAQTGAWQHSEWQRFRVAGVKKTQLGLLSQMLLNTGQDDTINVLHQPFWHKTSHCVESSSSGLSLDG